MELSRRRLFGFGAAFLAAPAIVRVAALMPISVLPKMFHPSNQGLIESFQETIEIHAAEVLDAQVRYGMDIAEFRKILMPGLRDHFAKVYEDLNDEFDQVWRS